jgi:hypothetical protein
VQGDPLILQMDDMVLPIIWKFKYRYALTLRLPYDIFEMAHLRKVIDANMFLNDNDLLGCHNFFPVKSQEVEGIV